VGSASGAAGHDHREEAGGERNRGAAVSDVSWGVVSHLTYQGTRRVPPCQIVFEGCEAVMADEVCCVRCTCVARGQHAPLSPSGPRLRARKRASRVETPSVGCVNIRGSPCLAADGAGEVDAEGRLAFDAGLDGVRAAEGTAVVAGEIGRAHV